jgi:hypothetical protein
LNTDLTLHLLPLFLRLLHDLVVDGCRVCGLRLLLLEEFLVCGTLRRGFQRGRCAGTLGLARDG